MEKEAIEALYAELSLRLIHRFSPIELEQIEKKALLHASFDEQGILTFTLLFRYLPFFHEIFQEWLLPGRKLDIISSFLSHVRLNAPHTETYQIAEVKLSCESRQDFELIKKAFPRIKLLFRMNCGQLEEMRCLMLRYSDIFKAERPGVFFLKIVAIQAKLLSNLSNPFKFKLLRKNSKTLSVIGAIRFENEREVFEQKHFLQAIQTVIPDCLAIENSFFSSRDSGSSKAALYLEVVKKDGGSFLSEELASLSKKLQVTPECLMPVLVMPLNDEEIMRTMLALRNQLKYLRDIPQVSISFSEQTLSDLYFTVIAARIIKPETLKFTDSIKNSKFEWRLQENRSLGFLRNKYAKEGAVFQVRLPKEPFYRRDQAIDLLKARSAISRDLKSLLGEFRDYNGGMIAKQSELLSQTKELIPESEKGSEYLMESFFYSLTPPIMRSLLDPKAFQTLFLMLLRFIAEEKEPFAIKTFTSSNFVYLLLKSDRLSIKDEIGKIAAKLNLHASEFGIGAVQIRGHYYLGALYRCDLPAKQHQFIHCVQTAKID